MKKFIVIALVIVLLGMVELARGDPIPAPFSKVKELCLKSQPDAEGDYVLEFPKNDNEGVFYIIGYVPRLSFIGIGMKNYEKIVVMQYNEKTQEFSIYFNGMIFSETPEKVLSEAFQIFRELVEQNIV